MTDNEAHNAEPLNPTLQEDMQEEFMKKIDEMEVGQPEVGHLVTGTVVQVGTENVFVDIGYKSEGRVPVDEFTTPPQIGDEVDVVLLSKETRTGGISVSKKKADEKA